MLRIPKLAKTADGQVCVTHWGQASGSMFRVGDRLILDQKREDGLLVLVPNGRGHPMLGRRDQGRLITEPSGVPASTQRWSVAGALMGIERDLERGGMASGRWWVAVRVESDDLAAMAAGRNSFEGGWMDAEVLDALCRRAAVAPEDAGVSVAIAAADDCETAARMVESVATGRVRFGVRLLTQPIDADGVVVRGPWDDLRARANMPYWAEEMAANGPLRRAAGGGGAAPRVQLSLFGDTA